MNGRNRNVVLLTPAWIKGDGVGHDIEGMVNCLSDAGYVVHVYTPYFYDQAYNESWKIDFESAKDILQNPDSILIYHHSIGCDETESLLRLARSAHKIMRYHNVTPPEFFADYNSEWVDNCKKGREATMRLTPLFEKFLVPSYFNARDLIHAGARPESVSYLPYFHKLIDFDSVRPSSEIQTRLMEDDRLKVLFVGRRVSNKGHLHLIRSISSYIRKFDSEIVLNIVGSADSSLVRYDKQIEKEIISNGIENNVFLHDKLSFSELISFYKYSDVFLCLSEHEGFCIPIIEAEYSRLPVIAYYCCGVPEALGPTQRFLNTLNYEECADSLRELRVSPDLRSRLGEDGARYVRDRFNINDIRSHFIGLIDNINISENQRLNILGRNRKKIAFVVQRYGRDVAGGAEMFARLFAERMCKLYDITILTTTSKTLNWDSSISECQETRSNNLSIIRFNPIAQRDWQEFHTATDKALNGDVLFREWLEVSGPYVPDLRDFLLSCNGQFDLLVNWTYLYSTAAYVADAGLAFPTICVPFFHDEPNLYIPGLRDVHRRFDGFIFQTNAERSLGEKVGLDLDRSIILGCGIEEKLAYQVRSEQSISPIDSPYLLYIGRIEPAKGVLELRDLFLDFKAKNPASRLKLVMVGRVDGCEINETPDIILPGFIPEHEKYLYLKHCSALVNPSKFESFSLVLIEAWFMSRPVIVNAHCGATEEQVRLSGGGFSYKNYREFEFCLRSIEFDRPLAERLGNNGNLFYEKNYRWDVLIPKFTEFLESFM